MLRIRTLHITLGAVLALSNITLQAQKPLWTNLAQEPSIDEGVTAMSLGDSGVLYAAVLGVPLGEGDLGSTIVRIRDEGPNDTLGLVPRLADGHVEVVTLLSDGSTRVLGFANEYAGVDPGLATIFEWDESIQEISSRRIGLPDSSFYRLYGAVWIGDNSGHALIYGKYFAKSNQTSAGFAARINSGGELVWFNDGRNLLIDDWQFYDVREAAVSDGRVYLTTWYVPYVGAMDAADGQDHAMLPFPDPPNTLYDGVPKLYPLD